MSGENYDGHGNELSMAVRVREGLSDSERTRSKGYIPTPTVGDSRGSGSRNTEQSKAHSGISLTDYVRGDGGRGRMWPTPHASASTGPGSQGRDGGDNLQTAVQKFPTPQARDWKGPQGRSYKGGAMDLPAVAARFPTPKATDWKGSGPYGGHSHQHDCKKRNLKGVVIQPSDSGQLNPAWVEVLMGFEHGWTDMDAECEHGMIDATTWTDSWEDGIPRVANGVKNRVGRLRCLGNAVVPQVVEWIARRLP